MTQFIEIPASKMSIAKRRPLFGHGINDADYIVHGSVDGNLVSCPFYRAWRDMIKRCYCHKFQSTNPTYVGCSVSTEWLTFSVFKEWMTDQDWQNKELDKDILIVGNKEYSSKSCIFISRQINSLLLDRAASRGEYPQGTGFHKLTGKYRAYCNVSGKSKHLGLFEDVRVAEIAYLEFKSSLVESIASKQALDVKAGLLRHAKIMTDRIECIRVKDLPSNFNYQ